MKVWGDVRHGWHWAMQEWVIVTSITGVCIILWTVSFWFSGMMWHYLPKMVARVKLIINYQHLLLPMDDCWPAMIRLDMYCMSQSEIIDGLPVDLLKWIDSMAKILIVVQNLGDKANRALSPILYFSIHQALLKVPSNTQSLQIVR